MKKLQKLAIIVVTAVVTLLVVYQLGYSFGSRLFEGMKGIRGYRFELGMSSEEAEQHFSDYGEFAGTIETEGRFTRTIEIEEKYGEGTWLTYQSRDGNEILELRFTNNRLSGFLYVNWAIR